MATDMAIDSYSSTASAATEMSEIASFYNGTTVFLTGATGFIGSLILEKLLRTCSGVKLIYILIREKKGKHSEERFKELFDDPLFEVMKKQVPNYLEKISLVIGDCTLPNMGICEQYQKILENEVNIIIHSAATVRFDEHLRKAVNINIVALQYLLKISKLMKNLKSFIHISTAYSNCAGRKVIDEVFYKPPISADQLVQLIDILDDDYIRRITPSLLNEYPNTYTMTKSTAEYEIFTHGTRLPIGIIRPSMITATEHEPIPGWINNIYGPTGAVTAAGIGLMRVMRTNANEIADIVPGDYVSNAVLACAWDVHNKWKEHNDSMGNESFLPLIYNYVSSNMNRLTWAEFLKFNRTHAHDIPSAKAIWPIMLNLVTNKYVYMILCFLLHIVPAFIVDSICILIGKKPQLIDGYRKLHKFTEVISYFSCQSWKFHETNTKSLLSKLSKFDQFNFQFDMSKLIWNEYFKSHVKGIRIYIVKDPLETIPQGLKRLRILYFIHYTLLTVLAALFLLVIYGLF
ncbi:Male sterility, NAD-binding,NAD(P)-binding domain,Fatty acyl-CoA reductase, C-terminal [Cinara cedri]|uniref:Fatty acyl-CoA reductase n=1 Tax=Cinara cedri TaxID=506608 RepID=A0A5E4MAK8_9HEMI|nr:Male sterility, NAD-binding,NAD(P)-binding domain,Fatty acyl-CoA reductase, C-terminal [Cinara cedri]